jgi:pyruvate kinase
MKPENRSTERQERRSLSLERAARGVEQLRLAALAAEAEFAELLDRAAPESRESAYNLAHYLAVRRHDVRPLQDELAALGLSSLGRMEAHVMASLDAVGAAIDAMRGRPRPQRPAGAARAGAAEMEFGSGDALLADHANATLGPSLEDGRTRIMVTMPSEAAADAALLRDLLDTGMDLMRVNCAHDGPLEWVRMVEHMRAAEVATGRACRVSFDLAGPKLRTGPIAEGPRVAHWRPERDALGRVAAPARVRLSTRAGAGDTGAIPVIGDGLANAREGDVVSLTDTRGHRRELRVRHCENGEAHCEAGSSAYVVPGTRLTIRRKRRVIGSLEIGALPANRQAITLRPGDRLDLVRGEMPGHAALFDEQGGCAAPAQVGCSLPEVFRSVRPGERILFDDGRIGAVVRSAADDRLAVQVVSAAGGSAKLRSEKGINLPDTDLRLPALTPKDLEDLQVVAKHGDLVALSFVQQPGDIVQLLSELERLQAGHLGVILKIETQRAFERLPVLLLTAMRHPRIAVMVARGDLGVEVGFERLSEVQEEILWLCEAAHVPVIWATQVLESLAKGGMPSRAEVTDAAMASRAECVMLNKGPYIRETLRFLVDVLRRMRNHQHKKTSLLRRLRVSASSDGSTAPPDGPI